MPSVEPSSATTSSAGGIVCPTIEASASPSRLTSLNVGTTTEIAAGSTTAEIAAGIRQALSLEWRAGLKGMVNPYAGREDESVSAGIKNQLKSAELGRALLKKRFHDLLDAVDSPRSLREGR